MNEITETTWTTEEAARYLRLSAATVRAMARRGEIPAFKVGRSWRIDPRRLLAYLQAREQRGEPA